MKREEVITRICAQFDKNAKQFCTDTEGLFCELSKTYKGAQEPQNLQYCFAKIYYNSFAVKFIYTAHATMNVVNSVLGCSVCFDKNDDSLEIPLPLLTDYCDFDITTPMFIPFISNQQGMIQAFDCIGNALQQLLPKLINISCSLEQKDKILTAYIQELKYIFSTDVSINTNGFAFYEYFTLRFTSAAFMNYIKGNYAKAIEQLRKEKKPTSYETRLRRLWSACGQREKTDLSAIVENIESYNESGIQKADFKEFGVLFLSWLLLTPATSVVYLLFYFLLVWIEGQDSAFLMGPMYNFPFCILFGFITAISLSYFTRLKFYKWLNKKDFNKYCEMDSIQNGGKSDRTMKRFTVFLCVIGMLGCVLLAKWNLNFLSEGFVDNSKFLSLKGKYYSYSEVEKVYYKPNRVNGFNEIIDFPSYVLVLENGEEIDLYEHGDIADYENALLEHLRAKGIKIEKSNP